MKKTCEYTVETDVKNIYCNLENCRIIIEPTEEKNLVAKFGDGVKVNVANNSTDLVLNQRCKLLQNLLGKTPEILISVPEHLIVNLIITGKSADVVVDGGIYGDMEFSAERCAADLRGIAADSVTVRGTDDVFAISESTVKGNLLANIERGNFAAERCFAAHVNCRVKNGNVGAVELNCRDSILEVDTGNVDATILGDEKTFNLTTKAKEGTCNKESVSVNEKRGSLKAFTECGNINLEFIQPKDYSPEEEAK